MNKIIDRNNKGQFVEGNKVGIGRPSRAIELDYLRSLSDTITVDDWRDICSKAVKDAKAGNAKAREWITRHVLGSNPTASLMDIAIRDAMIRPKPPPTKIAAKIHVYDTISGFASVVMTAMVRPIIP